MGTDNKAKDAMLFESIMVELFGLRWHTDAAEFLGNNRATVTRWADGVYCIPAETWDKIETEMQRRVDIFKGQIEKWAREKRE